jgi:hypothetical protein
LGASPKVTEAVYRAMISAFISFSASDGFESAEIYISLHPGAGFLWIREYKILSSASKNSIVDEISRVKPLVKRAKYSPERFKFNYFVAIEEKMFKDRGNITGEYKLLSKHDGILTMMEDGFGKALNCPVKAFAVGDEVRLFIMRNDIEFRGNNSKRIFEDDKKKLIVWSQTQDTFEVVFGSAIRSHDDFKSIYALFGDDVASREWTEQEIHDWKRKNRK